VLIKEAVTPTPQLRLVEEGEAPEASLDAVFFALADPVRRAILERLDDGPLLVSELAAPFEISLQAVSRHIQVLVRAGLIQQERTGRISRCSLVAGPIFAAAVWINRYSKYWQQQFDLLALALDDIGAERGRRPRAPARRKQSPRSRIRKARTKSE
jgi:DNA-binding transcriptional ArsR family regulator